MALMHNKYLNFGVISLFLVYFYFSNYIYGTFFRVDGESVSSSIKVPPEMSGIIHNIESVDVVKLKWKQLVRVQGWAVDPQQANPQNTFYVILKSHSTQLVYETFNDIRPDIYKIHKIKKSGFRSLIAKDAIPDGRYRIGVINTNPQKQYLAYTNSYISKINSLLSDKFIGEKVNMKMPRSPHFLDLKLEIVQPVTLKGNQFLHVQCFALTPIDEKTRAYFILNDGRKRLIYDAASVRRPDIVAAFDDPQLINSGVETYIPMDSQIVGDYKIGLLLVNDEAFYAENDQTYTLP